MSTKPEIWLLFGYFVCIMFQRKKQTNKQKQNKNKKNGVNLLY